MQRFIFSIVVLLIGLSQIQAQSLDSLKILGNHAKSAEKAKYYNPTAVRYYNRKQYDSAVKYLELAALYADQNNQFKAAGQAYNNAGVISSEQGDYKNAISNYDLAMISYGKTNNDTLIAKSQTNIGIALKRLNLYDKALEYLYPSAEVLERLKLKTNLAVCYDVIGNIHRDRNDMAKSFRLLTKSLQIRQEIDSPEEIAKSYQNLGNWYLKQDSLFKAKAYFEQSLRLKKQLKNRRSQASTLAKLGELFIKLDSLEKGIEYLKGSLEIREESNNTGGIATSSNHLAQVYIDLNDLKTALPYLENAINHANKGSLLEEKAISLGLYQEISERKGDYRSAYMYSNQLKDISATILNKDKERAIIELDIKYETSLKDKELAFTQSELDSLSKIKQSLIAIVGALSALAIMIIVFLRQSRKLSKERKKAKERVERLLNELNHRTKNHLQAQSGLIKQQMLKLKDQSTMAVIKDIDNQIKSINLIHQSLYASTEESPENINLKTYVQNIVENLMISFGMTRNQIQLTLSLDGLDIDIHKAMPIGLILNEAVTNAFKHAFKGLDKKALSVNLKKGENQNIYLIVKDNGKGNKLVSDDLTTSGLGIMKNLAEELNGFIKFNQADGFIVQLEFSDKK